MSATTSLRGAVEDATDEVEIRIIGVLQATEGAALAFISAIFVAVEVSVRQVVQVVFGLANTVVTEGFTVVDAVVTAALGAAEDDDELDNKLYTAEGNVSDEKEAN